MVAIVRVQARWLREAEAERKYAYDRLLAYYDEREAEIDSYGHTQKENSNGSS